MKEQKQNCELLTKTETEQKTSLEQLRSQLEEQQSLLAKKQASGTYKTWTIILLGILLTIASVLSAQNYL